MLGDHYFLEDGTKVSLLRSKHELAVRLLGARLSEDPTHTFSQLPDISNFSWLARFEFGDDRPVEIIRFTDEQAPIHAQAVAQSPAAEFAYPVLVDPESLKRLVATDELLVRLRDGVSLEDFRPELEAAGCSLVRKTRNERMSVFLVRLQDPKEADPLQTSRKLAEHPLVQWATPNFTRQLQFFGIPNDPLFYAQWHLHNTGQNFAKAGADVDAPEAWDITTGSSNIVIAIIDDGIDLQHPDLRLWVNPGESGGGRENNRMDDDGNGYVDDFVGWNFKNNNNNPNPGADAHGMGCAGVAAAIGNNNTGVAGIAYGCRILPVKISDGTESGFSSDVVLGEAISYAARYADVLNNSWGGVPPSSFINNAIDDAVANGRGGKGCPVFFATGNSASTWGMGGGRRSLGLTGLSGSYQLGFSFQQGFGAVSQVAIDDVCILDSDGWTIKAFENFEGPVFPPSGWLNSQIGGWVRTSQNALRGTGGSFSARIPLLGPGAAATIITPPLNLNGNETLAFAHDIFAASNSTFEVKVWNAQNVQVGSVKFPVGPAVVTTEISWPARHGNAIAVGASTDQDFRSDYSQFGAELDFVAPSAGGLHSIVSLDQRGSAGRSPTDYNMHFGGTSSACPLAAGIGALVLSVNPELTATEVRTIMRNTCDQIGGVTYVGGRHPEYGHGRVNARRAVEQARVDLAVSQTDSPDPVLAGQTLTYQISVRNNGPAPARGVVVTDKLPLNVTYLSATSSQGVCTFAAGTVTCNVGSLNSAATANITVTVRPNSAGTLSNLVTATANALDRVPSNNSSTITTTVNVGAGNHPPTLSDIPDQFTQQNVPVGPIPFNVGDAETPAGSLTLSANSSSPVLIPNANIVFGGSGANRTLTATPATGQTGTAIITVTVTDGGGATASDSFVLTVQAAGAGGGGQTFANANPITVPDNSIGGPYPSTISVSGLAGSVSKVTVTLRNVDHSYLPDWDALLVSPAGQKVLLMSLAGATNETENVTLVFDDAAPGFLTNRTQTVSGSYRPTSFGNNFNMPAPAPASPYGVSLSTFNGTSPNGNWSLYVRDAAAGDVGQITGGWNLTIITTAGANTPPLISAIADQGMFVNAAPSPVSFSVQDAETPAASLVLSASSSNPALVPGTNLAFGGSGTNRTITITPTAGQVGVSTITITVADAQGATASRSFEFRVISQESGSRTFANTTPITIHDRQAASPYPSTITVEDVPGVLSYPLRVTLHNLSHTYMTDLDIMLVGPQGQGVMLVSDWGVDDNGLGLTVNNATWTFDDDVPSSPAPTSGTYRPVNWGDIDPFPAPCPYPLGVPGFFGYFDSFYGKSPNGTWSLYVVDDAAGDVGMIAGGWSIEFDTRIVPEVAITSPLNGAILVAPASIEIQASASIAAGSITNVEFRVFGNLSTNLGSAATAPYSVVWTNVPEGHYRLNCLARSDSGALTQSSDVFVTVVDSGQRAFGGAPWPVPGIIQAEDFDEGGSGISFLDTTPENLGGQYRNTPVDIEACNDVGGGFNLSHTAAGEWLEYTIDVAEPGAYTVEVRMASAALGPRVRLLFGGVDQTGSRLLPNTGGLQAWHTFRIENVWLDAGRQVMRLSLETTSGTGASANVNYLRFIPETVVSRETYIDVPGCLLCNRADPYPSSIEVSGLSGTISNVTATLRNVYHTFPADIDILLVGPQGQSVILMSDVGGGTDINGVTLTFDDAASSSVPSPIVSGTFRPTNIGTGDTFYSPAPSGPYGSALSVFQGTNPNGSWHLFVVDDELQDIGSIRNGWQLNITRSVTARPRITDIAHLRGLVNPSTYVPLDSTTIFTIEGIVTTHTNLDTSTNFVFYMQDHSGGMAVVVEGDSAFQTAAGERVRATGQLTQSNGLMQLLVNAANSQHAVERLSTQNPLPPPIPFDPGTPANPTVNNVALMEALEASLVVVSNVFLDTSLTHFPAGGAVVAMTNASGAVFNLRLNLQVGGLVGRRIPRFAKSITGNIWQSDPTSPYTSGYFLLPTHPSQIEVEAVPPTISNISDQTTIAGVPVGPIPFTIYDAEASGEELMLSGSSSHPGLVSAANIVFGGSGANRTVMVSPVAGQTGTTVITVTVTSPQGISASDTFLLLVTPGGGQQTFANPAAITINDYAPATPFPSTINVTGLTSSLAKVTVTLNGFSHTFPYDVNALLVGPEGQKVLLMSGVGDGADVSGVVLTFDDNAPSALGTNQVVTGAYQVSPLFNPPFSPPAPLRPYATALAAFNSTNPNGIWSLYVEDDLEGDAGVITGGWSLTLTLSAEPINAAPFISSIADQAVTLNAGTGPLNFIISDNESPAGALTVSGSSDNPLLVPDANIAFAGSGPSRSVNVTPASGQAGIATITLVVTDTGGKSTSTSFTLIVGGSVFANPAPIDIVDMGDGTAVPYPATITVAGLTGAVGQVIVQLAGLHHTYPADIDMLLVGPDGQKVLLMSDAGGGIPITNVSLSFADSAAKTLPQNGAIITGIYKPTNFGSEDFFPNPAPGGAYGPELAAFKGTNPNGIWSLFVFDDFEGDAGAVASGWRLIIVTDPSVNTPPTISAIEDQVTQAGTATAELPVVIGDLETPVESLVLSGDSSNTNLVPQSGITFGGSRGNRTVRLVPEQNKTGTASITVTVKDSGNATAHRTFDLIVRPRTTTFANTNSISIPLSGSATPYPSVIQVAGLSEPVSKVTVTLGDLNHTYPSDLDLLLVGPHGQSVVLMSDTGGGEAINGVIIVFDDDASNTLSETNRISSGVFKPTNYGTEDFFAPPAPPGNYGSALTVFNGTNPNGPWSLFIMDGFDGDAGAVLGGWGLNFEAAEGAAAPQVRLGLTLTGPNQFHLSLNGPAGRSFMLERSTDLRPPAWMQVHTGQFDFNGTATYLEDSSKGFQQFYRARLLP